MTKLEVYRFSEEALKLVQSYSLSGKNRARLGSDRSQWSDVRRGCPQGSSFGPLLWNVFQNDVGEVVIKTDLSMYADDHQTFSSDNSVAKVEERLLHDANKLTSSYGENLLKVNIKKYQSMVLGKRISTGGMDLRIGGVQIEQSSNMKLLV